MHRRKRLGNAPVGFLALVLLGAFGCGNGKSMVEVTGNVTYQGKPVDLGNITFTPLDRTVAPAGSEFRESVYRLKVPVGMMKVAISGVKKVGQVKRYDTPDSPMRDKYEDLIPKKYSREPEITAEIKSDTTKLDFDLK